MESDTNLLMFEGKLYDIAELKEMIRRGLEFGLPTPAFARRLLELAAEAEKSPLQAAPKHKSDREIVLDAGAEAQAFFKLDRPIERDAVAQVEKSPLHAAPMFRSCLKGGRTSHLPVATRAAFGSSLTTATNKDEQAIMFPAVIATSNDEQAITSGKDDHAIRAPAVINYDQPGRASQ